MPRANEPHSRCPTGRPRHTPNSSDLVDRISAVLDAHAVQPGDRVAVQAPKTVATVALYLACLKCGAVYLPLNPGYRDGELEYFLRDARPVLFVGGPGADETIAGLDLNSGGPRILTVDSGGAGTLVDAARGKAPRASITWRDDADLAAILYTSGTTGRSKGAMLTHANLASNAATLVDAWALEADDVLIHALPIFHIHGLFVALNTAFLTASSVFLLPTFDTDEIIRLLPRSTVMMGVPTFYTRLIEHPGLDERVCARMRLFVSGSAPLKSDTFDAFVTRTGHAILERYGMSEAGMIASNPYRGERRPGSVGRPLPGVELRIADTEGRALPTGEVGGIEIRGPNVFAGYWEMPDKTRAEFRADGFFVTGDLGTMSEDGYVTIVGRSKDLVISGGYNVYPKEVEIVLDACDDVFESAVIGVPHPDLGEAVVAIIVPSPGTKAADEAAILTMVKRRLASYKVPKHVAFVDALPRNTMGKVQKNLLREQCASLFDVGA